MAAVSSEEELAAWLREVVTEDGRKAAKRLASSDEFRHLTMERLARAKAELAILDEHGPNDTFGPDDICCSACGDVPQVPFPCRTVRLLAGGYRRRPGYREEWKP